MVANYVLHQVFSARGAYIHVGAMLGTMMAANVFFHIIPGQKKMVEQIRRGEQVDPMPASSASSARCITPTSRCRCCSS